MFCRFEAVAGHVEFEDDAVVDQAVDGGGRGHSILEDLLPFAERQVACQHHAASLVAFGQKGEQHLHLFAALLDVAQVVDDQRVELRQVLDDSSQPQVAFGNQE